MKKSLLIILLFHSILLSAQVDRKEVRGGNREYKRGEYESAYLSYRKALERDSSSIAATYNLANTLFKRGNSDEAEKRLAPLLENEAAANRVASLHYNLGNYLLDRKEYEKAIEHYKSSLRENPSDIEAKSNLAYAQKMLKDKEKDQQQDQEKEQDQDKDKQQDPNQEPKEDPNQDKSDKEGEGREQEQQSTLSPQAMQQLLQAIRAKEQETHQKVEKEKAKVLESRKREKNW
ncbi:MAG: tetratricopeptide repeat protein [Bacteroidales bacterium]